MGPAPAPLCRGHEAPGPYASSGIIRLCHGCGRRLTSPGGPGSAAAVGPSSTCSHPQILYPNAGALPE
jgi:hypothetical protein